MEATDNNVIHLADLGDDAETEFVEACHEGVETFLIQGRVSGLPHIVSIRTILAVLHRCMVDAGLDAQHIFRAELIRFVEEYYSLTITDHLEDTNTQ